MDLSELKEATRNFENKVRELKKAAEMLKSFKQKPLPEDGDLGTCVVIVLNEWMDCPWGMATALIQAHVDKLYGQAFLMAEVLHVDNLNELIEIEPD